MLAIIIFLVCIIAISLLIIKKIWNLYSKSSQEAAKTDCEMSHYIELYDIWLRLTQDGFSIPQYLKRSGINNVAICSLTDIGIRLYNNLKNQGINVVCIIDSQKRVILPNVRYISPEDKKEDQVEMVIITDSFRYETIKEKLTKIGYQNIESIDDLLYSLLKIQAENEE